MLHLAAELFFAVVGLASIGLIATMVADAWPKIMSALSGAVAPTPTLPYIPLRRPRRAVRGDIRRRPPIRHAA